jgi:hypothetical protein
MSISSLFGFSNKVVPNLSSDLSESDLNQRVLTPKERNLHNTIDTLYRDANITTPLNNLYNLNYDELQSKSTSIFQEYGILDNKKQIYDSLMKLYLLKQKKIKPSERSGTKYMTTDLEEEGGGRRKTRRRKAKKARKNKTIRR